MSTFKELVNHELLSGSEKCNFYSNGTPDGCWALDNGELPQGNILCIEYLVALDVLPKLIIDSFINKYGKKPNESEFTEIMRHISESMKIAIDKGRTD